MRTDRLTLGFSYLRLSVEEAKRGESSSITNQRLIVESYCKQNGITLVREFADDGYSGGNFDRPGFQDMMRQLADGKANTVITKDLSRLGRDMREASYYAEQFFPEHGIHYIAIADNFDTEADNIMAPFQFAMNEVYLRDCSRKIRDTLKNKRENGQYCHCPPYGYKRDPNDKNRLAPDEATAPVVREIFRRAALGDSSRRIALDLSAEGIVPPLKYRVLYRDDFSDVGAARASDYWNNTTVKRILQNQVYLGHTILGKSRKVSFKSHKKIPIPQKEWAVTKNTHPPLVSETVFERAHLNLGKASKDYREYDHVRKSIFSGIVFCAKCGHSLCSCGTVYKGEREKYWYLSCTQQRADAAKPCSGVRIKYTDLIDLVRNDLNKLLAMDDAKIESIINRVIERMDGANIRAEKKLRLERAQSRIVTIDKIVTKLYTDNAEGKIDDDRLHRMVQDLERESVGLRAEIAVLSAPAETDAVEKNYARFFELARRYTQIDELDRETLLTFVDRIEVGPKVFPDGVKKASRKSVPYRQMVQVYYKFIGEVFKQNEEIKEQKPT